MQLVDVLTKSFKITAATPANRFVKFSGTDGEVSQSTADTDIVAGVLRRETTAAGQVQDVGMIGIFPVEYGATINQGNKITSDADGKAKPAVAGDEVHGIAMEDGDAGTIGSVFRGGPAHLVA